MLRKKSRKLTYWLAAIGVFLLILGGWQFYKYRLVNRVVNKTVTGKSGGLYQIHYEGLVIDEAAGAVHVKNIEIIPDTLIFNRMASKGRAPSVLVKIRVPELNITGVKTPKALLNKEIEGRMVEMSNPTIEVLLSHFRKDSTVHDPSKDISREILGRLLKIQVDSVAIRHAGMVVREIHDGPVLYRGEDLSLVLSDLLIDSVSGRDSARILFSKELEMHCAVLQIPSTNKRYKYHIGELAFRSRDNELSIGRFRIMPQLGEEAFAASWPRQKDRYDFDLQGIRLVHIDRAALWKKRVEADSMLVRESSFKIYRDLSYPRDTVSKLGRYPQQLLTRLKIPVNIRQIVFEHSFIEYKEKNAKSDSAGRLQFFEVNARIGNVTNERQAIAEDNRCVLSFRAKLLNRAPVNARLVMLLRDPKGRFGISGEIGAIDAVALNPMTQPMGLARMEKGRIDRLHFDFKGSDSSSDGKLEMLYHGLKISLLKKDEKHNEYDKKGLATLLANVLMKKSNPAGGGDARVASVHFDRILDKSFFNLIWKSIFTGIKQEVGMK